MIGVYDYEQELEASDTLALILESHEEILEMAIEIKGKIDLHSSNFGQEGCKEYIFDLIKFKDMDTQLFYKRMVAPSVEEKLDELEVLVRSDMIESLIKRYEKRKWNSNKTKFEHEETETAILKGIIALYEEKGKFYEGYELASDIDFKEEEVRLGTKCVYSDNCPYQINIAVKLGLKNREIELLEERGLFHLAANTAKHERMYERAVILYKKAGQHELAKETEEKIKSRPIVLPNSTTPSTIQNKPDKTRPFLLAERGMSFIKAYQRAKRDGVTIASHRTLDGLIMGTDTRIQLPDHNNEDNWISHGYWSGTLVAYESKDQPLGPRIMITDEDSTRWIFPVPPQYQGRKNIILVVEPSQYNLEINRYEVLVRPDESKIFPLQLNGYLYRWNEFGQVSPNLQGAMIPSSNFAELTHEQIYHQNRMIQYKDYRELGFSRNPFVGPIFRTQKRHYHEREEFVTRSWGVEKIKKLYVWDRRDFVSLNQNPSFRAGVVVEVPDRY